MTYSEGSSIKYVRKIFRKTNISNPPTRTHQCAYKGVRNVSFSGNFAYVFNGWSQRLYMDLIFSNKNVFLKRKIDRKKLNNYILLYI